ncbi:SDR family NAD(P)-dependent oxidoreductase [Burkholderia multivorans]|uniref:SDR family NAD(P)-dependent oxidoreductase n=1 Tax=Burkholderia multivorans TaxID=87883 RepID=UPI00123AB8BF|nr:SDR family NAD(P)-dependent oxidoreductase [Burkholderia multivorans]QET31298.1 SDR family NAD(P)-dependent oxidoreductase [Burkholderia multivorans]QET41284.1 SDR family NAD(P)-dependent oxidoreductase [Burkholderia multivorans]UQN70215.1 SDR family NAD(P)-dependent oxidoreductase [Burkholderia multivorans]UQN75944.1 SDR family NAD(P)-dependent oxidoreductase [Burkholderia multivorans]
MNTTTDSHARIWFITGISRGFGKVLTEMLLSRGEIVIGTTRGGPCDIAGDCRNLHVLKLEITDPDAITRSVKTAFEIYGRVDVIVNNAGYGLLGSIEEASEREVADVFEVNFHGPRRVIQAALPFLRAQGTGHIINVTSIAGIAPAAGSGFYAAAKSAVEGMSQSLSKELAPLNIHVTLVEPGAFRTDFLSPDSIRLSAGGLEAYAPTVGAARSALAEMAGKQRGDPRRAASAIIAAVDCEKPPLHLVLGPDAYARTRDMLAAFSAELDAWEGVAGHTDFE